jgi:hypothetical protein
MRKQDLWLCVWLLLIVGGLRAEASPELAVLDQARTLEGDVRVQSLIEVWNEGELVRSSLYEVYVGSDRRSLALAKSGREAGQKVLMLDDQFWLFLPMSQRPIRITPMQKMLGDASVGDISSLRWQEDYRIMDRQTNGLTQWLTLEAVGAGLSYQRIELHIRTDGFAPLNARFYLTSGKLAKTATFELSEDDGDLMVTSMTLTDEVVGDEVTRIHYQSVTPMQIPERWFSPAFLARNPLN